MIRWYRENSIEAAPSIPSARITTTSKNCAGMVTSGFLVEVERADLDGLRKKYPEAFSRPYDYASGLKFERVLAGGEQ